MSGNVVSVFGGPSGQPEINSLCVETLREWLEMAESGEIIGVAVVGLCKDGYARRQIGGVVGGHALIGAAQVNVAALVDHLRGIE